MPNLEIFKRNIPSRPFCTDDPTLGQSIKSKEEALTFSHIQPNTKGKISFLVYDVDHPDGATSWSRNRAPAPSISIENKSNGHAHLIYILETPVPISKNSREKPIKYLNAVKEGLRRKLDSDKNYMGGLCKNPMHDKWDVRQWEKTLYSLEHLSEWITIPSYSEIQNITQKINTDIESRNCLLFEKYRNASYKMVRDFWGSSNFNEFREAIYSLVEIDNAGSINPLPSSSVRSIASSCARWTWKNHTPSKFSIYQSKVGALKGAKKRDEFLKIALSLAANGKTQREISAEIGVSQKTVSNWLKNCSPNT